MTGAGRAFDAFAELDAARRELLVSHRDRIEGSIADGFARGVETWPNLSVPLEVFACAFGRSLAEEPDPLAAIDRLHVTDLYLAQACAIAAPNAIAAFEAAHRTSIHGALRALGLAEDASADIAQQVREKLFVGGKIATYSARASLESWIRTIATRTAVSSLRRRAEAPLDDKVMDALPSPSEGPDEEHFRITYRAEFKQAFEEAMTSLTPQQRNLLRHRFVDGLSVDEIGGLYGVHKTTASRWLESARTTLAKRTRNGFQQRTRATPSEMRSIIRIIESNVELSLRRVLS